MKIVSLDVAATSGMRLDQALLEALRREHPTLSRAALKPWFSRGDVLYRERPAPASFVLSPGSHEIRLRQWTPESAVSTPLAQPAQEGAFLPVVYEDADLLVLHKYSGVPSVPQAHAETETAVGAALAHFPGLQGVGRGGYEPGILHRLDTGTSGLLAFAKNGASFEFLREAWQSGHVKKFYRAISRGAVESDEPGPALETPLLIDVPLGHDLKSAKRMRAVRSDAQLREIRGKPLPARTTLLDLRPVTRGVFEAKLELHTGVMHQIRCHMAMLGWPLLGDAVYRGVPSSRLWLHAWRLELPMPEGGRIALQAALPERWPGT